MTEAKILAAETAHGNLEVYCNDKPIADALQQYGEWAGIETEFLQQFIPHEGVVIDAGCHVGLHSAAFAENRPGLTIHAFEPQPTLLQLTARNIEALDARKGARIVLHAAAVGEHAGQVFMTPLDFSQATNAGASKVSLRPLAKGIAVAMTTLDQLDTPPVAFIKFDLEGHEGAALRGAQNLIRRDQPVLFCEINSVSGAAEILDAVRAFDYRAYFVETAAFNPRNTKHQRNNLFGHAHESGLLLLPPQAPIPVRKRVAVLEPVTDLDKLATLLMQTPRYGDATVFDHKPALLRAEIQKISAELTGARAELETTSRALAITQSQLKVTEPQWLEATRAEHAHLIAALRGERDIRMHMSHQLMRTARSSISKHWKSQLIWLLGLNPLARDCRRVMLSGLFDRRWYRKSNPDVAASGMHPLVHYLLFGAYEGRQPNPVFDSRFYVSQNPDVRESGINPLLHYINQGEAEGRPASATFLPAVYLARHPNLKKRIPQWRRSPLRHFLRRGRIDEAVVGAYRPKSPAWAEFENLRVPQAAADTVAVDVIVPVYNGYADTFACLLSVLQSRNRTAYELIVIDDCSPDPRISADLRRLADLNLITLLRNEKNLGFVGTVNRGMLLHKDRDVLLLNSDTLVFNDWLDRIRAHTGGHNVASVTPFTNNGTICSYPYFCRDNSNALETSYAELDRLAAATNQDQHVEVPTGVGFCMYIARAALTEVGLFDVDSFGAGYGEENDFCMRAINVGWKNLHALDTFVFHSGETSFAENAAAGKKRGYQTLLRLHPDYERQVNTYIKADPPRFGRIALDIARAFGRPVNPLTICFTHSWGGGIDRHLEERRVMLNAAGKDLLIIMPATAGTLIARLMAAARTDVLRPSSLGDMDLVEAIEPLCMALRQHGVEAIEVHSTVGWSIGILQTIQQISARLSLPYSVTLHDYATVCPQITFINETGRYCGEKGPEQCKSCLTQKPERMQDIHPDWKAPSVSDWRQRYSSFLEASYRVAAPSDDAAARLRRYFPHLQIHVQPHLSLSPPSHEVLPPSLRGNKLRVAIIGAIGPHKGSRVLQDCASDALSRKLALHFSVIGYTDLPTLAQQENISVTGPYREEEVYQVLAEQAPHVIFLPSVWPETFSYTLSIAMAAGLPTVVFDLGAQAERLQGYPKALALPLELADDPAEINDRLLAFAQQHYSED